LDNFYTGEIMINWEKQPCGVHHAPYEKMLELMPDLEPILETFPDNYKEFTWDVKVHMLMPRQYHCIPNWHTDNVPRENGIQKFDQVKPHFPMYIWISGAPLTQFKHGYLLPQQWHRFTQLDEHRGTMADNFGWRGFIRATHKEILKPKESDHLRRHIQVYLDAETYQW
jgi:hypothetical protein